MPLKTSSQVQKVHVNGTKRPSQNLQSGRGCGLVVSVLTFYSDDLSSNPV